MSRVKSRQNTDVCADCGAADPTWASVNRGILLCVECCSIHRSLGRHISQVKPLQKNLWSPTQLAMVQTLNGNGVNSIWEHSLLDNNSKFAKRKPQPKDPLHPVKADFIKAKHQQFAFVFHPNRDDTLCTEVELSKQLHSSVRTQNLETSVRLLVQGADPNYFHDEKGTTPLHVVAKANQILQAELLVVYGADPSIPDGQGKNAIDYARQSGHKELADRLMECVYEVTDRLSYFLCGKKAEHLAGQHLFVPDISQTSDPMSLARLQKLSNHLFEELVTDVYDEIDRRETEAIWLSSADCLELCTVPFLPVDPGLSATRNQGRQKLARFTARELSRLVFDILVETRRRQLSNKKDFVFNKGKPVLPTVSTTVIPLKHFSHISDDEPLYDSVASDDDYAALTPVPSQETANEKSSTPPKLSEQKISTTITDTSPIEMLMKRLLQSDNTISGLRAEVRSLQALVEQLCTENSELKSRLSQATASTVSSLPTGINSVGQSAVNGINGPYIFNSSESSNQVSSTVKRSTPDQVNAVSNSKLEDGSDLDIRQARRSQRPTSMYETREGLRTPNWQILKNQIKREEALRPGVGLTQSMYGVGGSQSLDQQLTKCTEKVTRGIQELWVCMQEGKGDGCVPCADKIRIAVNELTSIVPQDAAWDLIKQLLDSTSHLEIECISLQGVSSQGATTLIDYYLQQVRARAYDIAKITKQLVTKFQTRS